MLAKVRNVTLACSQNGFMPKEKHCKSLAVLPPIRKKKEHFLTYYCNVLREILNQREELNILCKLLKTVGLAYTNASRNSARFCVLHCTSWFLEGTDRGTVLKFHLT